MCSLLITTISLLLLSNSTIKEANKYLVPRGPDAVNEVIVEGVTFVHHLLSMTGRWRLQPFVQDRVVALFNGEIYNYQSLLSNSTKTYLSDGEVLLDAYAEWGSRMFSRLDGEFAIVIFDFERGVCVISTDTFGSKPLFMSVEPKKGSDGPILGFSSYAPPLQVLGHNHVKQIDANTVLEYSLEDGRLLKKHIVTRFNLRQFKTSTSHWLEAFREAVAKRVRGAQHPVFIGLSSGYDSGAINLALEEANHHHLAYTVRARESLEIVQQRYNFTKRTSTPELIMMTTSQMRSEVDYLQQHIPPYRYRGGRGQLVVNDGAAPALSYVCRRAATRGARIHLSGTGADEIISDYGFQGKKIFPHSSFGGLFPEDLETVFPWRSFFGGTMKDYLAKEEVVVGSHGMESRYPFLDKQVVQEYLWLTAKVKNSIYKRPIDDYFKLLGYPYENGKQGFGGKANLIEDEEKEVGKKHVEGSGEKIRDSTRQVVRARTHHK